MVQDEIGTLAPLNTSREIIQNKLPSTVAV
jgi:hypothetical protein